MNMNIVIFNIIYNIEYSTTIRRNYFLVESINILKNLYFICYIIFEENNYTYYPTKQKS